MRTISTFAVILAVARLFAAPDGASSVTPTDGRIAFEVGTTIDGLAIYTAAPEGSGVTRLTPPIPSFDGQPVYSPDGTKIAFHAVKDVPYPQLYIMNADGSGLVRVTNNAFIDASPSWSPDGTKLAFDSERGGNLDIYVINVDGTGEVRLTTGADVDAFPAWSPDGTKIAFQSDRDGDYDIYLMNSDGSGHLNITNNTEDDYVPDWSPSGSKMAFVSGGDTWDVYTMNADGSNRTRLTTHAGDDSEPEWSPDGTKILFSSERSGNGDIWSMNANGTNQVRLLGGPEPESFPDWSPPICTVQSVVDGDTFTCSDGTVVDMLQIDAPELGACGGEWAKAALGNIFLTPGRTVALSFDQVTSSGNLLAAPIARGTDGVAYNVSIVMAYVGLAKAATVGAGNTKYLNWANASQGWAQAAQWNMWAPGKTYTGGCD
jgi:endonuclease YncB( thermonuclease family)